MRQARTHIVNTKLKSDTLFKLLEMSEAMLRGDYSRRVIADFDDDIATQIANNLNSFADKIQLTTIGETQSQEQTVKDFIEVISSYINLDFKQKLKVTENGIILDAIATGINILGEELEQSTASKKELELERNRLNEAEALAKVGNWQLEIPSSRLTWSQEAYRIFELEKCPDESLYERAFAKIHPDERERVEAAVKQAVKTGENLILEYKVICNNDVIKHLVCLGEAVKNAAGDVVALKGTIQDITDRKNTEESLKKAKEDAEEANRSKSTFLANMSHEIRTPLNGILGLTEVMIEEGVNESQRKYLEIIRNSGKNLARLINDILDFSKIESGKLQLEHVAFNFNEVITSGVTPYKFLAEQKGLVLKCHIDRSIPSLVIGDPTRLTQLLVNLIGNAIKFTEEGRIDVVFCLLEDNQGQLHIQGIVKDTGIGIPPEKAELIFQSFTQADDSVTRRFGGTGLGLSIVKSLLQQMNGDISVQSPVDPILNRGSAFSFTLKLGEFKQPAGATAGDAGAHIDQERRTFNRHLRILIVDDNKVNLLVAKQMVKKFGAEVFTAEDGLEAVGMVKDDQYDLILMDIQMPRLNGYEATMELRKMNYTRPIIALSANAYREDVEKSIQSGMNDHIQKPYTQDFLFQKIVQYINA